MKNFIYFENLDAELDAGKNFSNITSFVDTVATFFEDVKDFNYYTAQICLGPSSLYNYPVPFKKPHEDTQTEYTEENNGYLFLLGQIYLTSELQQDIYNDLYFNLIYNLNKETYVKALPSWEIFRSPDTDCHIQELKDEFLGKLHDFCKSPRQERYKLEFQSTNKRRILNVAPNISRLLIVSSEFRNMLRNTNSLKRKDYNFTSAEMADETDYWKLILELDDFWMVTHLLDYHTAFGLYSMFSEIFKGSDSHQIAKHYSIMEKIIELVMKWPGLRSRQFICQSFIQYYKRVTVVIDDIKLEGVLIFLEKLLTLFLDKNISKYNTLMTNTLCYEYSHCEKDKPKLKEKLATRFTLQKNIFIHPDYLTLPLADQKHLSLRKEPLYKFILGNVIKYSHHKGN